MHKKKKIHITKLNNGLKNLVINVSSINDELFDNLPESIEVLDVILQKSKTKLSNLPNKLKFIRGDFGSINYNQLIEKLPESLVFLNLRVAKYGNENIYKLNYNSLPSNLKYIDFN